MSEAKLSDRSSLPSAVYGEITGQLWELFKRHMSENNVLLHGKIRSVVNSIGLFPTHSQIHELVHIACEQSGRMPVDHITFGEFCLFVTELKEHYRLNIPGSLPRSQLKQKAVQALEQRRLQRRFSGHASGFQVFLGGSCNPTTWRHDIAIPFLKKHGITFYNPQVSNWRPELMEMEDQAKQTAELLFFVVDNQTRSTASMVEAAYIGGCARQLILVIKRFQMPIAIYEEFLLESEIEDLERSHTYLTDLIERMSIPVFSDIDTALNCTKKAVLQNIKVSDLAVEDGALPVQFPHARVAKEVYKVKDVFNTIDTASIGKLSAQDIRLAFRTITNEELPFDVSSEQMFTFEDFCCLLSEHRYRKKSLARRFWSGLLHLPARISNWYNGHLERRRSEREPRRRDVFLGGSCGNSRWRDEIAIPILMKHGISYYNPQLENWNTYCIPLEAAIKDGCQLLLFVITEDTRAMTSMIEAGFFIGQGCNIVLCIQDMKYGTIIDNEELTRNAINDYNRARTYLADLANRDGVPVLDSIVEAIDCVVEKLKEIRESEHAGYS